MKIFSKLSLMLSTILIAFTISACAPTATQEGTGGYIDDSVITTKVKTSLLAEKGINSTEIKVVTFKGRVQLSGFVSSKAQANKAIETTRKVSGVRAVSNNMIVK